MENTSSCIHKQYKACSSLNILWYAESDTCPPKEIMQYLSKINYLPIGKHIHRTVNSSHDRYTIHTRIFDDFQSYFH